MTDEALLVPYLGGLRMAFPQRDSATRALRRQRLIGELRTQVVTAAARRRRRRWLRTGLAALVLGAAALGATLRAHSQEPQDAPPPSHQRQP